MFKDCNIVITSSNNSNSFIPWHLSCHVRYLWSRTGVIWEPEENVNKILKNIELVSTLMQQFKQSVAQNPLKLKSYNLKEFYANCD